MALRKASDVAQELVDRHEHFERDFKAGKAPPKSLVTADRLALVQRLRVMAADAGAVGATPTRNVLLSAADELENEIKNAAD